MATTSATRTAPQASPAPQAPASPEVDLTRERTAPPTRIVLIGLMASGKTAIGKALTRVTGWRYLDNDTLVLEHAGANKQKLIDEQGEAALRESERFAFGEVLSANPPLIASIAGGVLLDPSAVTELAGHQAEDTAVVWLQVAHSALAKRIREHPKGRPWVDGDLDASIARLASVREPVFARIADVVIESTGRKHDDVAAEIIATLGITDRRKTDEKPDERSHVKTAKKHDDKSDKKANKKK